MVSYDDDYGAAGGGGVDEIHRAIGRNFVAACSALAEHRHDDALDCLKQAIKLLPPWLKPALEKALRAEIAEELKHERASMRSIIARACAVALFEHEGLR